MSFGVRSSASRRSVPTDFPEPLIIQPNMEEFSDFPKLIGSLEERGAHQAGFCKIVVPEDWIPRKSGYNLEDFPFRLENPLKQVFNPTGHMGKRGAYQTKCRTRPPMTIKEYFEMATNETYSPPHHSSYEELERKYWRSLKFIPPVYGADVTQSLTDPDVKEFNIGNLNSILNMLNEGEEIYHGVNSPYLYFGMWRATFSWHVEDMDLYAINMVHKGAPKSWYCVPPKYGYLLERATRELFPDVSPWCTNFMRHKSCLIEPKLLHEMGVPFQKLVQKEREIIIVFPYAYHSGFNHGFNIAESTNFAFERWIEYGKRHKPCSCARNRVKFEMTPFVKRYQDEKYEDWVNGKDIQAHPEDPPELVDEVRRNKDAFSEIFGNDKREEHLYRYFLHDGRSVRYDALRDKTFSEIPDNELTKFQMWKANLIAARTENFKHRNKIAIDIYKHSEFDDLEVRVFRENSECMTADLEILRQKLNNPHLKDVRPLIKNGDLVWDKETFAIKTKAIDSNSQGSMTPSSDGRSMMPTSGGRSMMPTSGSRSMMPTSGGRSMLPSSNRGGMRSMMPSSESLTPPEESNNSKQVEEEKSERLVYKHVEENIQVLVDSLSKKVVGKLPDKLKSMLTPSTSMAALIKEGTFKFSHVHGDHGDINKNTQALRSIEVFVYEHVPTGYRLQINSKTGKKMPGRLPKSLNLSFTQTSLKELIENGTLKFIKAMLVKHKPPGMKRKEGETDIIKTSPIVSHTYFHKIRAQDIVHVEPASGTVIGKMPTWLKGKSISKLKEEGEIIFAGERILTPKDKALTLASEKAKTDHSIADTKLSEEAKIEPEQIENTVVDTEEVSDISIKLCKVLEYPDVDQVYVGNSDQRFVYGFNTSNRDGIMKAFLDPKFLTKLDESPYTVIKQSDDVDFIKKIFQQKLEDLESHFKPLNYSVESYENPKLLIFNSPSVNQCFITFEKVEQENYIRKLDPSAPKGEVITEGDETFLLLNEKDDHDFFDDEDFLSEDEDQDSPSSVTNENSSEGSGSDSESDPDYEAFGSRRSIKRKRKRTAKKKSKKARFTFAKREVRNRSEKKKRTLNINTEKWTNDLERFFNSMKEQEGEVELDAKRLVADNILHPKKFDFLMPILGLLGIVRRRLNENPIWLGISQDRLQNSLHKILDISYPGRNEGKSLDITGLTIAVLRILVIKGPGVEVPLRTLEDHICSEENFYERQNVMQRVNSIRIALQCIGLMPKKKGNEISCTYSGPDIFKDWEQNHFDSYLNRITSIHGATDQDNIESEKAVTENVMIENMKDQFEGEGHLILNKENITVNVTENVITVPETDNSFKKETVCDIQSNVNEKEVGVSNFEKEIAKLTKLQPLKFRPLKRVSTKGLYIPRPQYVSQIVGHNISTLKKNYGKFGQEYGIHECRSSSLNQKCQKGLQMREKEISYHSRWQRSTSLHWLQKEKEMQELCWMFGSKCEVCCNCLNPSNKQTCVNKVCAFPIIPKCPCFD